MLLRRPLPRPFVQAIGKDHRRPWPPHPRKGLSLQPELVLQHVNLKFPNGAFNWRTWKPRDISIVGLNAVRSHLTGN
jgi:hypothetical protein